MTRTVINPLSYELSILNLAKEAVKLVKDVKVVGLGSGSTVSFIV